MHDPFVLDSAALRRSFDRASGTFDAAAVLHGEVRQRALQRLRLIRAVPEVILDLGAGTGTAGHWFATHFPRARVIAVDRSIAMLREGNRKIGVWRRLLGKGSQQLCGDATRIPLRDASVDWTFANLLLPWCPLESVLAEIRRVLKPNGVFAFTSFGPDTLSELRAAWGNVDTRGHVHAFMDMHDLGDALVRAGFAEPVLDIENFTLTYPSLEALLSELQAVGSRNALPDRSRGLTGKSTLKRLADAYEIRRTDGTLPATFEVVYGQAWSPAHPRRAAGSTEAVIPIDSIRGRRR